MLEPSLRWNAVQDFVKKFTGRPESLMARDLESYKTEIKQIVSGSSALVIGGAGSIGSSFIKQLIEFSPKRLVVIDSNENGLTELVRDLRSQFDIQLPEEIVTYPMDFGNELALRMIDDIGPFDLVANFAALKHVRTEKNAVCAAYMINNNVLKNVSLIETLLRKPPKRFFCVSTDKAANPVNIMGASKKLMEEYLLSMAPSLHITTARFANVAFSNGSLLDGFVNRISKGQPLSAPNDVQRYFVSYEEAGQLCLLSCILGESGDIFVPKLNPEHDLHRFSDIAREFLGILGLEAIECSSEEDAKERSRTISDSQYPCFFFDSNTTGEKEAEEFFLESEQVESKKFTGLRVVRYSRDVDKNSLQECFSNLKDTFDSSSMEKSDIVSIMSKYMPTFNHLELGRSLDQRM